MLKKLFKGYDSHIIELIDKLCPLKRTTKISTRFCLENICKVLTQGISWKCLCPNICHFTTIYKRFVLWSKNNVFSIVWTNMIELYKSKQPPMHFRTIFIDSTMVKNHYGIDCTGYNHFDRNRKATKVSIICDSNKIPLAATYYKANKHDSTTIENTLDAIKCKIRKNNRFKTVLIGDKGYIIKKERREELRNIYKVELITPLRKNQKITKQKKPSDLMKDRYVIENVFCRLDKFKRIRYREDRHLTQFISFHELAIVIMIIEHL